MIALHRVGTGSIPRSSRHVAITLPCCHNQITGSIPRSSRHVAKLRRGLLLSQPLTQRAVTAATAAGPASVWQRGDWIWFWSRCPLCAGRPRLAPAAAEAGPAAQALCSAPLAVKGCKLHCAVPLAALVCSGQVETPLISMQSSRRPRNCASSLSKSCKPFVVADWFHRRWKSQTTNVCCCLPKQQCTSAQLVATVLIHSLYH